MAGEEITIEVTESGKGVKDPNNPKKYTKRIDVIRCSNRGHNINAVTSYSAGFNIRHTLDKCINDHETEFEFTDSCGGIERPSRPGSGDTYCSNSVKIKITIKYNP